jgi:transcriptional regulator with XRE-family HTH domain
VRLKDLREDNDLKQTQIADYLNIKQNTYSQYETGKREIPLVLLWKLADYYNTSIDYLVGRTDFD